MMISQRRCLLIAMVILAMPGRAFAAGSDIVITSTTTAASGTNDTSTYKSNTLVTVSGSEPAGVTIVVVYFSNNSTASKQATVDANGKWQTSLTAPIVQQNTNTTLNADDQRGVAQSGTKSVTITP